MRDVKPCGRLKSLPTSTASQSSLAQKNRYTRVAYFMVACSKPLHFLCLKLHFKFLTIKTELMSLGRRTGLLAEWQDICKVKGKCISKGEQIYRKEQI
jgi:hypothetical protein